MTEQVPKFGWGHINVNVSNLERSIAFYEKLGFQQFIPAIPYLGLTAQTEPVTLPQSSAMRWACQKLLADAPVSCNWMMGFLSWTSPN